MEIKRKNYLCERKTHMLSAMLFRSASCFAVFQPCRPLLPFPVIRLLFAIFLFLPSVAAARNVDSLLLVLDTCIAERAKYEQQFLRHAESLRREADAASGAEALRILTALSAEEYRHSGEEALKVTEKALALARRLGDRKAEADLLQRKALVFGMMGFPWDGERLLDSVRHSPKLMPYARRNIYTTYYDLHDFYQAYNMPGELSDPRYAFLATIEDSVRRRLDDPARQAMTIHYATYDERQMIKSLESYLDKAPDEEKGIVATVISNKYFMIRDIAARNYYWALAAIYNIKAARHENEALTRLAIYLFETGDTERAVRYVQAAYDDARIYNTRIRKVEVAAPLARGLAYETERNNLLSRRISQLYLIVGGLVLALVAALTAFILSLRRQRSLRQGHGKLTDSHRALIGRLREEVGVKSEYITRFLELSLDSVFQIEQLRSLLLVKARNGETDRLLKILNDPARFDDFRRVCLQRFDIAFLRLYPDFMQTVNSLIRPEEQIRLPDTEILSNELRVLAFMRLGITDSPRIATILGVSTNTVYFYRNKLRRKAVDRENFEKAVMAVCGEPHERTGR